MIRTHQHLPVASGVPQGSVLGPIVFSLFINDIPDVLKATQCYLYADDVQLLASRNCNDVQNLIYDLNLDLASVSQWAMIHLDFTSSWMTTLFLSQ